MGYLVIGLIWSFWLEWYTTNKLPGLLGRGWVWRERVFHTLFWPFSLSVFIYNFFKGLW